LGGKVFRGVARNSHDPGFGLMMVMPVTASATRDSPAVRFDQFDRLPDLHSRPFCNSSTGNARETGNEDSLNEPCEAQVRVKVLPAVERRNASAAPPRKPSRHRRVRVCNDPGTECAR